MKTKRILLILTGTLMTILFIGWLLQYNAVRTGSDPTVSMHGMEGMANMPMMEKEGDPASSDQAQVASMISPARGQFIGVKTAIVQEQMLTSEIRASGIVTYDERRIRQINLRISGWITKLFSDYTGKSVKQGDPLFSLYSPDLFAAEQEYLLSRHTLQKIQEGSFDPIHLGIATQESSAQSRLRLLGLTEAEIHALEQNGTAQTERVIRSPLDGVVTQKNAISGMYVTPEMNLYEIADLSTVWVHADLYEYELAQVAAGQEAEVALTAYPGERFWGKVVYIYPYLNKETRTITVRMEFDNVDGKLKPNMYGEVWIKTGARQGLALPEEAVLDSGRRTLIFIDKGSGIYEPREVKLEKQVGRYYPVVEGINSGEKVVTSATFLIDSESKLMAATNIMGMLGMGGVKMEQAQMGEMEMGPSAPVTDGMSMEKMKGMSGMEGM